MFEKREAVLDNESVSVIGYKQTL